MHGQNLIQLSLNYMGLDVSLVTFELFPGQDGKNWNWTQDGCFSEVG